MDVDTPRRAVLMGLFDLLLQSLSGGRAARPGQAGRHYRCRCGQPVFFRNSRCLACQAPLGFDTERLTLVNGPAAEDTARPRGTVPEGRPLQRCANFQAVGCNWLLPAAEAAGNEGLCRACRLNRTVPDPTFADNAELWRRCELAKRRLVSQLLALGLPLCSRVTEDPQRGLMFDLLRTLPGQPQVMTGHAGGLITLNVEEADDARREKIRAQMHEPYRTLLGHFRHEVGHYYWDRLVAGTPWLPAFRARFGDEQQDYAAALRRHYEQGPAPDWAQRCVSAYASTHPWEDWAETWAHYLHMLDTLDTALSFGLEGEDVEIDIEPYGRRALDAAADPGAADFLRMVNGWLRLTAVLNELSRSMGQADFYPFVLSEPAEAKLHLVHRIVRAAA